MKRTFFAILLLLLLAAPTRGHAQEPREKLLEDALIWRLDAAILKEVKQQFWCEHVTDIQRDKSQNNHFIVTVEVVTFTGPHNPPNDLVRLWFDLKATDEPKVLRVERKKNISKQEVEKRCDPAIGTMLKEARYLTEQNWEELPNVWKKDSRDSLRAFLLNRENREKKAGYLNIKKATLEGWRELPVEVAERYFPVRRHNPEASEIRVFYIMEDLQVHRDDPFFLNGRNYFIATLVKENGEWKFGGKGSAPVQQLIRDGYGFGTPDEKTYSERRWKHIDKAQ